MTIFIEIFDHFYRKKTDKNIEKNGHFIENFDHFHLKRPKI